MTTETFIGPVSFAVFLVPDGADLAGLAAQVRAIHASHTIEVLDLDLIGRAADGSLERRPLIGDFADLAALETDLLDEEDLEALGEELTDGENAFVLLYEDRSLAGVAEAVMASGGRELWVGGIAPDDLEEALVLSIDAIDPTTEETP